MNFWRGGVTPIRKISLQILAPPEKKRNIVSETRAGGGQRPFGSFPKIHPFGGPRRPLAMQDNYCTCSLE